jgi:hypothetical protein
VQWLNEITFDRFRFFVVKFGLLQISGANAPGFTSWGQMIEVAGGGHRPK